MLLLALHLLVTTPHRQSSIPPYKDPIQPIEVRVEDLLKRMTLEEKLNQLRCDGTLWEKYIGTTSYGETLDILRPLTNLDPAKKERPIHTQTRPTCHLE